jgi:hypothetical protein
MNQARARASPGLQPVRASPPDPQARAAQDRQQARLTNPGPEPEFQDAWPARSGSERLALPKPWGRPRDVMEPVPG